MDDSGPSTAASTNATKQGRDVKDSDKKEDSSPTKQMTQRLASGMHTMADKSKGALHSAAHTVGALSKKAATSAANTVKHGTHLAALPFKDTLKDTRESEPQDKSVTLEPTVLNTPTLIPTLTDEVSARPVDANQHNLLSSMLHPRSSMSFQDSGYVDDDRMILWIVVASVAFLQTIQNLGIIFYENVVPFSVVLAWMLVAFTAGMEVDATILVQEIKYRVLGPNLVKLERSSSIEPMESTTNMSTAQSARIARRRNPIRIFQKMMSSPTNKPHTCLARSLNRQDRRKRNMRFDSLFVHRLSHFGRNKSKDETTISLETTTTTAEEESDGLGRVDLDDAQATVLLSKMQVEPLCQLRGIDIFLTECAESEMSTHPFLRRNGLGNVPTFMINIMTQWGSLLVYLELPEWIVDRSTSLVENQDDPDSVKVLKRFLVGDDDYRRDRLKIIPELVEAPYPIRMIASKNKELQIHSTGWLETNYYSHCDECPIWEMNVDCMGNSAIRGMASLVRRYLSGMKADFALVISHPDELGAVLGLWRFDHLDVNQYPTLPDRYEGTDESVDATRAYQLVQEASQRVLVAANKS